jgi:hypothetical protein
VTGVALANPSRLLVPCGGMRAAPSLALAMAVAHVPTEPPSQRAEAPRSTTGNVAPPSRLAAAALLALALAILIVAVVARTRLRTLSAEATPQEAIEHDAASRLTLVPLPRERGP